MRASWTVPLFVAVLACGTPEAPEVTENARSSRGVDAMTREIRALRSLPYASATFDPRAHLRGVTVYKKGKAFEGLNFYCPRTLPAAFLVDMEGKVLHQWRGQGEAWQHVDLLPDGDVLVLVKDKELLRLDHESNVVWRYQARVHHDLFRAPDGRIFVLTRQGEDRPDLHPNRRVLVDRITVLSDGGEFLEEHSVLELFERSPFAFLLPSISHRRWPQEAEDWRPDILHTNHVEVLGETLARRSPFFAAGRVLLGVRNLNAVAVADLERGEVVWVWGPSNLTRPHHPTVLDNGNLLVFDNGFSASAVLEVDPLTRQVVWSYEAGEDFFSLTRGSNQRLGNGNTLITESDPGYVFEVTPAGEVVWEFANPAVNDAGERSAVWRMVRLQRETLPFLD